MADTVAVSHTDAIALQNGATLQVERNVSDVTAEVVITGTFKGPCVLHWGVLKNPGGPWLMPPEGIRPQGSVAHGDKAVQTPFETLDGVSGISIRLNPADFLFIVFVIYYPEERRWDNNYGKNYQIDLLAREAARNLGEMEWALGDHTLSAVAMEIIGGETGRHSWTLMHRFNLCYDLLDRVRKNIDGMALIFTWLRFSAIRQLDWQRNYNTKPRELSHSLDRLTLKLAGRYLAEPAEREMIRLILTTLGRGGDGQRIRDEILNIMHRHHIKEVSGHFLEEWHQKLHNNTTPDDVVICEAYLQFLRHNGNQGLFYKTLAEGGVTRKRLQSYERPIRSDPDFIPYLKDVLIHDFEHFLGILKAVHSATDLGSAIYAARRHMNPELHGLMDYVWNHRNDRADVAALAQRITEARWRLRDLFTPDEARARDLLLLDISLEDFLRVTVEQNLHGGLEGGLMVDLVSEALANIIISGGGEAFQRCHRDWERLRAGETFSRRWSLHAKAVLDRIGRAIGFFIDSYYRLLQPKAELLGKAFGAESWTISLFSEEVVRGRLEFVLSMLIRYLDPLLREKADLGIWQVVSRGRGSGRLDVVPSLREIQGKDFGHPALILAQTVGGDEEIPAEVRAIITPAVVDVLSHIAVRARNSSVLFATCYDSTAISSLTSRAGQILTMTSDIHGNIVVEEGEKDEARPAETPVLRQLFRPPSFTVYALPLREFTRDVVGGKAFNLRSLREALPSWIGIPHSVSLPFGVLEKVMADDSNRATAAAYGELAGRLEKADDPKTAEDTCRALRETILSLRCPDALVSSLRSVASGEGISLPENWEEVWTFIKKVWGSKWNLRAYLSRKARGIPHRELLMAVLIQEVIDSRYSFVIHTVNPLNGNEGEIYAEVVLGLGEALVGNYPGKSLSFSVAKATGEARLLSFPDKDEGLSGGGLIFRSDSSGEDLAGYAGAGLYDSFILPEPRRISPDYSDDPLIWDDTFRDGFIEQILKIGTEVEKALGGPQDIEGAFAEDKYWVVQSRPQVGVR